MEPRIYFGEQTAVLEAWAYEDPRLILASFVGPREAVRAIGAAILQRHPVQLSVHTHLLFPEIMRLKITPVPGALHAIAFDTKTLSGRYLLGRSEEELKDRLLAALERRTPLPLHPEWKDLVWAWATEQGWIDPIHSSKNLLAYQAHPGLFREQAINDLKHEIENFLKTREAA